MKIAFLPTFPRWGKLGGVKRRLIEIWDWLQFAFTSHHCFPQSVQDLPKRGLGVRRSLGGVGIRGTGSSTSTENTKPLMRRPIKKTFPTRTWSIGGWINRRRCIMWTPGFILFFKSLLNLFKCVGCWIWLDYLVHSDFMRFCWMNINGQT